MWLLKYVIVASSDRCSGEWSKHYNSKEKEKKKEEKTSTTVDRENQKPKPNKPKTTNLPELTFLVTVIVNQELTFLVTVIVNQLND